MTSPGHNVLTWVLTGTCAEPNHILLIPYPIANQILIEQRCHADN